MEAVDEHGTALEKYEIIEMLELDINSLNGPPIHQPELDVELNNRSIGEAYEKFNHDDSEREVESREAEREQGNEPKIEIETRDLGNYFELER